MWGLILAGGVVVAVSIIIEVIYSMSLLKPVPYAFSYTPGMMDYAGEFLAIVGLALIMAGGIFKRE
jgi:chemotaxis signal transduction protein